MKSKVLISIICLVFTFVCGLPLIGQNIVDLPQTFAYRATTWNDDPVEIIVDEPGTLGGKLDSVSKSIYVPYLYMRNLKVVGTLNGDDIKSLHSFANQLYDEQFYRLDLFESCMVKGGDSLYVPEDNVMGYGHEGLPWDFPWPQEELILPNTLKKLIIEEIWSKSIIIGDSLMEWPACRPTSIYGIEYPNGTRFTVGFRVSENNPYLSSLDGTLFNKEGDRLLRYGAYGERSIYTVPNGVCEIAADAFSQATLTEIVLPEGIKSIGDLAFFAVYGLTQLHGGEDLGTNIKLGLDWLPSSLEHIGKKAFFYARCPIVVLPPNVKTIDVEAFNYWHTPLVNVGVPGVVSTYCELFSASPIPPVCMPNELNAGPFSLTVRNINSTYVNKNYRHACLYVPTGSKAAYEQAFGWGYECFENIIEVDDVMAAAREAIATLIETDIQHVLPDSGGTEVYETACYNIQGQRLHCPAKGWNIVRYSDGSTRKMYIK